MIAFAQTEPVVEPANDVPEWHAKFLGMLPAIRRYARCAFRNLPLQARHDAVDDVIANALVAFGRSCSGSVRRG